MTTGVPFEASYHGTCQGCEHHITPGDIVRYVDGYVEHHICPVASRPVTICPLCFLAKPCEHDE